MKKSNPRFRFAERSFARKFAMLKERKLSKQTRLENLRREVQKGIDAIRRWAIYTLTTLMISTI
jgi:hypothetical protein